jgi:hypothetical protein
MRLALLASPLALVAGVALASLLGGCAAHHDDAYPTVDDFCRARAAAECQIADTCGGTDAFESCAGSRADACVAEAAHAIGDRSRSYIAANAPACVDAVRRAYSIASQSQALESTRAAASASLEDACGHVFCKGDACDPGDAFEPIACTR